MKSEDNAAGALWEGRRLADRVVKRYADANPVHLQDVAVIDGKYHIALFATSSFRQPNTSSRMAMERLATALVPRYPKGSVHPVIVFPGSEMADVDWSIFPEAIQKSMEMDVFGATNDTYVLYGIDPEEGAIAVVRPDQFVGTIASLADLEKITAYLDRVLVRA